MFLHSLTIHANPATVEESRGEGDKYGMMD